MKLKNLLSGDPDIGPCIVGMGTFDGVHVGHRTLIEQIILCGREMNLPAVIFTFDHSPRKFLSPDSFKGYLTTPEEKFSLLMSAGIDYVVFRPFDAKIAKTPYREFVKSVLVEKLDTQIAFVGFNFCFGAHRSGNAQMLADELRANGRICQVIEPVKIKGETVSSTLIRNALAKGDFERTNRFLGREACFSGEVVHGDHRGRLMGFPTANLLIEKSEKILPPNGVYACYADTPDGSYQAIVNLGVRPTFNRGNHLLEAHLLGFNGDLYHQIIRVRFVKKIREEHKFDDMAALIEQIKVDRQACTRILPQKLL